MEAACAEVGRDPATVEVTAMIGLSYPELGTPDAARSEYLSGSTEDIVMALHGYAQMGVSHLMFQCFQYNETALVQLAEAMQLPEGGKRNTESLRREVTPTSPGLPRNCSQGGSRSDRETLSSSFPLDGCAAV
jgi:hypothetical protein